MRIAALDIGTNSIHVFIVQVRADHAEQTSTASRPRRTRRRQPEQARAGDRVRAACAARLPH